MFRYQLALCFCVSLPGSLLSLLIYCAWLVLILCLLGWSQWQIIWFYFFLVKIDMQCHILSQGYFTCIPLYKITGLSFVSYGLLRNMSTNILQMYILFFLFSWCTSLWVVSTSMSLGYWFFYHILFSIYSIEYIFHIKTF